MDNKIVPLQFNFEDELINANNKKRIKESKDNGNQFFRESPKYFINTGTSSYPDHIMAKNANLSSYTIDKTRVLEVIEINDDFAHYFVAPRRFGKTFTASMICTYYDYYYANIFEDLFQNTYIYNALQSSNIEPYLIYYRSKCFVFEMSFANINTSNYDNFEKSMLSILYTAFKDFSLKYYGIDKTNQLHEKLTCTNRTTLDIIINFIHTLIEFCQNDFIIDGLSHFQLLIFIDECQGAYLPYSEFILNGQRDSRLDLFSAFIGSITKHFKKNKYIKKPFLLMAGLIPLPHSVTVSKCDYINCHDIQSPIMSHFIGLLSADVEKMFNDFNVSQHGRELLRRYFNNYQLCKMEELEKFNNEFSKPMNWDPNLMTFYNPWSLMNSMKKGYIVCLFTGGSSIVSMLEVLLEDPKYFEIITELSSKKPVSLSKDFSSGFSKMDDYVNVQDSNFLIKLLIISGYLCISDEMVWIPNQEVHEYYQNVFKRHLSFRNIPLKLPVNISQFLFDRDFYLFFSYIQIYLTRYIPVFKIFNESVIQSLLFAWLAINLEKCQVFIEYSMSHKQDKRITKADIVIIDVNGLAIVFELKNASDADINKIVKIGYKQIFSRQYYDFLDNQNVKEVVLCSLAMIPTESAIIFSGPTPKHLFFPKKNPKSFPNSFITTSFGSFLDCKISFIESKQEDKYRLIDSNKKNSAIIIVDSIRSIEHVESLTSWKKIKAHSNQQKRDSIIASFPQQNPYLILSIPAIRALNFIPKPDVVFLLEPPTIEFDISKLLPFCNQELIVFYDVSQKNLKDRIENYFSTIQAK